MVQNILHRTEKMQKLNELKGTSWQPQKLWGQVEQDRGQAFPYPAPQRTQLSASGKLLEQQTEALCSWLIYLSSAKSNSCLYPGGLCCPSPTSQRFVLTAASWISSRQIQSLTCRSKEPHAAVQAGGWQAKQHPETGKGESGAQEVECVPAVGLCRIGCRLLCTSRSTASGFMGQTMPF